MCIVVDNFAALVEQILAGEAFVASVGVDSFAEPSFAEGFLVVVVEDTLAVVVLPSSFAVVVAVVVDDTHGIRETLPDFGLMS